MLLNAAQRVGPVCGAVQLEELDQAQHLLERDGALVLVGVGVLALRVLGVCGPGPAEDLHALGASRRQQARQLGGEQLQQARRVAAHVVERQRLERAALFGGDARRQRGDVLDALGRQKAVEQAGRALAVGARLADELGKVVRAQQLRRDGGVARELGRRVALVVVDQIEVLQRVERRAVLERRGVVAHEAHKVERRLRGVGRLGAPHGRGVGARIGVAARRRAQQAVVVQRQRKVHGVDLEARQRAQIRDRALKLLRQQQQLEVEVRRAPACAKVLAAVLEQRALQLRQMVGAGGLRAGAGAGAVVDHAELEPEKVLRRRDDVAVDERRVALAEQVEHGDAERAAREAQPLAVHAVAERLAHGGAQVERLQVAERQHAGDAALLGQQRVARRAQLDALHDVLLRDHALALHHVERDVERAAAQRVVELRPERLAVEVGRVARHRRRRKLRPLPQHAHQAQNHVGRRRRRADLRQRGVLGDADARKLGVVLLEVRDGRQPHGAPQALGAARVQHGVLARRRRQRVALADQRAHDRKRLGAVGAPVHVVGLAGGGGGGERGDERHARRTAARQLGLERDVAALAARVVVQRDGVGVDHGGARERRSAGASASRGAVAQGAEQRGVRVERRSVRGGRERLHGRRRHGGAERELAVRPVGRHLLVGSVAQVRRRVPLRLFDGGQNGEVVSVAQIGVEVVRLHSMQRFEGRLEVDVLQGTRQPLAVDAVCGEQQSTAVARGRTSSTVDAAVMLGSQGARGQVQLLDRAVKQQRRLVRHTRCQLLRLFRERFEARAGRRQRSDECRARR